MSSGSFSFALRPLALAVPLALGAFSVLPLPASAANEQIQQHYDIPAGPLASRLSQFAAEAGIYLAGDAELAGDRQSRALRGSYGVEEALAVLLAGSGLEAVRVDSGRYELRRLPEISRLELSPVTITGKELGATTEGSGSYTTGGVTISKGVHSLKETPQSVTVMTRKMLDDQQLNTIEQVMEKTPGITVYDTPMGGKYFYSRGFQMLGQYQYDGVPLDLGNNYVQADSFSSDMAFYDRVEVLRGAAGMMKGAGTSSGSVNFVRKRATENPHTELTLSGGSWDNYRAQVDTGGPLNDSGTLRGRAVVAQQNKHYFYDVAKRQDQIFYGALDYDLTPDTTVGFGMAYEDVDATPCWHGLGRYSNGDDLKLSRSTCLNASWNDWQSTRHTYFADVKHQFNDNWSFKVAGVYSTNTQDTKYAYTEGNVAPGSANPTLLMYSGLFDYDQTDYGVDAYVDGKFDALGHEHELIVGVNASRSKKDDDYALIRLPQTQNPFNPNHHIPEPDDSYYAPNSYRGGPAKSTTDQYGAYSTLRLKLADPLTFVLGSRVSWYKSESDTYTIAWDYSEHAKTTETGQVTPFAAVLYDLGNNLTAYASYSDIFTPQGNLRKEGGGSLKPLIGSTYELGIKGEWLDGRVNSSFNLFRTIQKDMAQSDYNSVCPASSDGYCYVNAGKVRAQGFETEISGEVIDRLQLLAGYTYTQTKVMKNIDENANGGVFNSYVPRHLLRVWADYSLTGPLDRFNVGLGVNAQSDNYRVAGAVKNTQAGYAVWSGRIGYRIDDTWSVAVNGNNLFDRRYYQSIGTQNFGNYYGELRNYMLTVKADF